MNGQYTVEFLDAEGVVLGKAQCPAELFMRGGFTKSGQVVSYRATDAHGTVFDGGSVTGEGGDGGIILSGAAYVGPGFGVELDITLTHTDRRKG